MSEIVFFRDWSWFYTVWHYYWHPTNCTRSHLHGLQCHELGGLCWTGFQSSKQRSPLGQSQELGHFGGCELAAWHQVHPAPSSRAFEWLPTADWTAGTFPELDKQHTSQNWNTTQWNWTALFSQSIHHFCSMNFFSSVSSASVLN